MLIAIDKLLRLHIKELIPSLTITDELVNFCANKNLIIANTLKISDLNHTKIKSAEKENFFFCFKIFRLLEKLRLQ